MSGSGESSTKWICLCAARVPGEPPSIGAVFSIIKRFKSKFLLLNLLFSIPQTIFAPLFLCVFAALEISRLPLKKPYGYRKIVVLAVGVSVFVLTCVLGTRIHP